MLVMGIRKYSYSMEEYRWYIIVYVIVYVVVVVVVVVKVFI